jgi:hypothetical protein
VCRLPSLVQESKACTPGHYVHVSAGRLQFEQSDGVWAPAPEVSPEGVSGKSESLRSPGEGTEMMCRAKLGCRVSSAFPVTPQ